MMQGQNEPAPADCEPASPRKGINPMSYYESAEDTKISAARALIELERHGVPAEWADFRTDLGNHEPYDAQDVLVWLGY